MRTRLLGGIAALLIAVIGTSILVLYVQNADRRAQAGLEPAQVLVVQEPVAAGTSAQNLQGLVTAETVPAGTVADDAVTTLSEFEGMVTGVDLKPGEQLLGSRLVDPAAVQTPGTARAPEGMQTISLELERQRLLGGTLAAGDTVGIFVSFEVPDPQQPTTKQILHKVLVTAVDGGGAAEQPSDGALSGNPEAANPSATMMVTVALNDTDAAKLVFGAEFGTIWFSHEPADTAESDPQVITKTEAYK